MLVRENNAADTLRVVDLKAEIKKLWWKDKTQEQESEEIQIMAVWHCQAAMAQELLKGNFSWLNSFTPTHNKNKYVCWDKQL